MGTPVWIYQESRSLYEESLKIIEAARDWGLRVPLNPANDAICLYRLDTQAERSPEWRAVVEEVLEALLYYGHLFAQQAVVDFLGVAQTRLLFAEASSRWLHALPERGEVQGPNACASFAEVVARLQQEKASAPPIPDAPALERLVRGLRGAKRETYGLTLNRLIHRAPAVRRMLPALLEKIVEEGDPQQVKYLWRWMRQAPACGDWCALLRSWKENEPVWFASFPRRRPRLREVLQAALDAACLELSLRPTPSPAPKGEA